MTSSGTNTYLYDGFNRRIKTQDSKGHSYSMYSQSGTLLYRETPAGGINYIYLGKKLVAKEGRGVVAKSDSIKNYKPFGQSIETAEDDVGYTGHKFDTDLGLSYMQQRYYDPAIGRFYVNDPLGFRDIHSFNRYAYANNNPYRYIDPDGRKILPIGMPEDIAIINSKLSKIGNSDPSGTLAARIIVLKNSKHTHIVRAAMGGEEPGNTAIGNIVNETNPGVGTGTETVLDLNNNVTVTNSDGSTITSSPETVLTHELLGHGFEKDLGIIDRSKNPQTNEKRSEESAMAVENVYKSNAGEKERTEHGN